MRRRSSWRWSALALAGLLAVLLVKSGSTLRTERSVDLQSGQVREQVMVASLVLSERVEDTAFSVAARKAGMPIPKEARVWRVDQVRYTFSSLHERPQYHGTIAELDGIAMDWALQNVSDRDRAQQAVNALRRLRTGLGTYTSEHGTVN